MTTIASSEMGLICHGKNIFCLRPFFFKKTEIILYGKKKKVKLLLQSSSKYFKTF